VHSRLRLRVGKLGLTQGCKYCFGVDYVICGTDEALSMPVGTDATTFPTYTIKINDVSNQGILSRLQVVLTWRMFLDCPNLGVL